jgi:hypothetical protein
MGEKRVRQGVQSFVAVRKSLTDRETVLYSLYVLDDRVAI